MVKRHASVSGGTGCSGGLHKADFLGAGSELPAAGDRHAPQIRGRGATDVRKGSLQHKERLAGEAFASPIRDSRSPFVPGKPRDACRATKGSNDAFDGGEVLCHGGTIAITGFQNKRVFSENLKKFELSNGVVMGCENLSIVQGMKRDRTRVDPASIPEIAHRLRLLRLAVAENATELSAMTGITRAAWSNYETAQARIGVDAAMKLCRAFGVTLDWIYFGDEEFLRHGLRQKIQAAIAAEANDMERDSA